MRRAYTAAHLPDAHLLAHSLEAHGIPARVFRETLQGGVGELPHVYPEVWIENESDWERARALISKFEQDVGRDRGAVQCPSCREENPASFEICWQCGTALPQSDESHGGEEEEKDR